MTSAKYIIVAAVALLFIGCPARSIFPLLAAKDVVFNPSLVGTWVGENEKETYTFQASKDKGYIVTVRDEKGDTSIYNVQAGQLGKFWFLNSLPAGGTSEYHMVPTNLVWQMWLAGDTLRLTSLEGDWLRKMIDSAKLAIPHVVMNGDVILTASTEELQQFVLHYANDTEAFPEPGKFTRKK